MMQFKRKAVHGLAGVSAVWLSYIIYFAITYNHPKYTTEKTIRDAGYPFEEHTVQTDDGYILKLHRIPYNKGGKPGPRPVFWLQHGVMGSSDQYVHLGSGKALAFLLSDKGYDVWLGNSRANMYSQGHISFNQSDPQYWDFSVHELGDLDLSAAFSYVLDKTKEEKIYYAGYSMGYTLLLILLTSRPEYQNKIELCFGIGPAIFTGSLHSTAFKFLSQNYGVYRYENYGPGPLFPLDMKDRINIMALVCAPEFGSNYLCHKLYSLFGGASTEFNQSIFSLYLGTNPSQTSTKVATQISQGIETGLFAQFHYGKTGNMIKYGSPISPVYDLKTVNVPMALLISESDSIITTIDSYRLCLSINNVTIYYKVPLETFNHLDFVYGSSAKELVYDKIFQVLDEWPGRVEGNNVCY